jgi:transposase
MNLILAHKIALDPNTEQRSYLARAAGTARFAYNWALAEWQRQHKNGGKPSEGALRRLLNEIKHEQFPSQNAAIARRMLSGPSLHSQAGQPHPAAALQPARIARARASSSSADTPRSPCL